MQVHHLDLAAEMALAMVLHEVKRKIPTAIQKTIEHKTREILILFAARAISPTVRVWLCGQALVGSDGSLWRSSSAACAIDNAFEYETYISP